MLERSIEHAPPRGGTVGPGAQASCRRAQDSYSSVALCSSSKHDTLARPVVGMAKGPDRLGEAQPLEMCSEAAARVEAGVGRQEWREAPGREEEMLAQRLHACVHACTRTHTHTHTHTRLREAAGEVQQGQEATGKDPKP